MLFERLQLCLERISFTTETFNVADGELVVITLLFEMVPELGVLRAERVAFEQDGFEGGVSRVGSTGMLCENVVDCEL